MCFGSLKTTHIDFYTDTNEREFGILAALSLYTIILGIYPNIILNLIDHSILKLVV